MFGKRESTADKTPGPEWAQALVRRYVPHCSIWFKVQPGAKPDSVYGCCAIRSDKIYIYAPSAVMTRRALMVVLHEITHALCPNPDKRASGRDTYHGPTFWNRVMELYADHGVLEEAALHEGYATGRKLARERLGLPALPKRRRVRRSEMRALVMK